MDAVYRLIDKIIDLIIQPLIYLIMAVALAYFVWGAAQFILNADDTEARKKGKQHLLWGLIGFFIMVGVLSILAVVTATFNIPFPPQKL